MNIHEGMARFARLLAAGDDAPEQLLVLRRVLSKSIDWGKSRGNHGLVPTNLLVPPMIHFWDDLDHTARVCLHWKYGPSFRGREYLMITDTTSHLLSRMTAEHKSRIHAETQTQSDPNQMKITLVPAHQRLAANCLKALQVISGLDDACRLARLERSDAFESSKMQGICPVCPSK